MNLNLYPYNFYILYASIALVVIMLIVLLVKLIKSAKTLQAMQPALDSMSRNMKLLEIKSEVINESSEASKKAMQPYLTLAPILFAIYMIYKNDEDLKGIKGYEKAARRYMDRQRDEKRIAKAVAKVLVK